MNDKAVEAGARTIDPRAWEIMDDAKAQMLKKYADQNVGYPANQYQHAPSMEKAKDCIQAYLAAVRS